MCPRSQLRGYEVGFSLPKYLSDRASDYLGHEEPAHRDLLAEFSVLLRKPLRHAIQDTPLVAIGEVGDLRMRLQLVSVRERQSLFESDFRLGHFDYSRSEAATCQPWIDQRIAPSVLNRQRIRIRER